LRIPQFLVVTFTLGSLSLIVAQSVPQTVAIVNGQAITEEDLGRAANGRIRLLMQSPEASESQASLERAKLEIRWEALNYLIERRLSRAEAERRMVSEDELIESEIDNRIEPPAKETVEAFTEANRDRMPMIKGLPPWEVRSQVGAFLTVQADRVMRAVYFEKLSKQYGVRTFLEPLRAEVSTAGHAVRGSQNSPVTIVVFSNFECSDCVSVAGALEDVRKNNSESVRIVYRHFPEAHLYSQAELAAEAASCAFKQQRFWEFHDQLFANSKELGGVHLRQRAAALGLDTNAFNDCLDSGTASRDVGKDIDEAYTLRVMVAPTLFVNGRRLMGRRSVAEIQQLVDEELRRGGN
jgi:protein-disulfide isomerase